MVGVGLVGVEHAQAVIRRVVDLVLVVIPIGRGIAVVTRAIVVGVGLVGVEHAQAVIDTIGNLVTVRVDDRWRNCGQRERRGAGVVDITTRVSDGTHRDRIAPHRRRGKRHRLVDPALSEGQRGG